MRPFVDEERNMTAVTVTAKVGTEEGAPSASVNYDFGDNLDEATELFGADVVFARFKAASVVDLQALIRRHLDSDTPKSATEIQELATAWKPGVQTKKRKSAGEKIQDLLGDMSETDRAALLESLMKSAA